MRSGLICAAASLISIVPLWADEPTTNPISAPATAPIVVAASQPSSQPASSPQAQALLEQVEKVYESANAMSWTGKISLDFDAGGEKKHDSSDFTASFLAPNKFRQEVKDDALIVSTGEKLYAYLGSKNEYVAADAPKERVASKDLPEFVTQLLGAQNPVLLMTLSKDSINQLSGGATQLATSDDVQLAETSYNALTFQKGDQSYRLLIDPATHFIRQMRIDRKTEVEKRGVDDVKVADVTIDYLTTTPDAQPAEQYAWAPPHDATVAKEQSDDQGSGEEATVLEGKPAPDFKLTGVDGKTVALADLKGSVVVLDFWATWCGPCVESLPHIDQINADLSDKGLKVFAINVQEQKAAVQKFILSKKLSLPVLLDADGSTSKSYLANAIPETVVVGKDGAVRKVFIGFGGDEEPLRTAIDVEMKK